ncbi:CsbD family protein [Rhodoferax sp. UBA5149]|uniref:CsbD family protein n=1 Tax=Rhodoferax sp. UBA5149 TaxID=1947379 RepID=UPI0032E4931E
MRREVTKVMGTAQAQKKPRLCAPTHRGVPDKTLALIIEAIVLWAPGQHPSTSGEMFMNKNQVHGAVKDLAGKIQQQTGKIVGNTEQQAKGLQKQATGKAEQSLGDAKEVVKNARDAVKDAVKKH